MLIEKNRIPVIMPFILIADLPYLCWQRNSKFSSFTLPVRTGTGGLRLHLQLPAMRLYYIIAQTQSQAGSLSGGFGGKEGLEEDRKSVV